MTDRAELWLLEWERRMHAQAPSPKPDPRRSAARVVWTMLAAIAEAAMGPTSERRGDRQQEAESEGHVMLPKRRRQRSGSA